MASLLVGRPPAVEGILKGPHPIKAPARCTAPRAVAFLQPACLVVALRRRFHCNGGRGLPLLRTRRTEQARKLRLALGRSAANPGGGSGGGSHHPAASAAASVRVPPKVGPPPRRPLAHHQVASVRGVLRRRVVPARPLQWSSGLVLFVDVANCRTALGKPAVALRRLARLPSRKGCHVLAMVEGTNRGISGPKGIHMVRAERFVRKDIGDDALVDYIDRAIRYGVRRSRMVLITRDKGLIARGGVQSRSPTWLRAQIDALPEQPEPSQALVPPYLAPAGKHTHATMRHVADERALRTPRASRRKPAATRAPSPESGRESWWQGWMASLRSLLAPLFSTKGSRGRSLERSPAKVAP